MLEVTDLTKRYGDVLALAGCSLQVPAGHLVGLLGPNGAGKTTVMRTLFGLVVPDAGTVQWRGRPVDWRSWRRFGYMPEERGLYPGMRAAEQIAYFGRLSGLSARMPRRPPAAGSGASGWTAGRTAASTGCPTATSSGSSSRSRWCTTRTCSCSMSRSPGWTRSRSTRSPRCCTNCARPARTVLFSSHQLDLVEHLCEDVVILDRGRVVLAGLLSELRARAPQRRLEVTLAQRRRGTLVGAVVVGPARCPRGGR